MHLFPPPIAAQHWGPWLAALPTHVDLPFLHWSDAEVAALADASAVQETRAMRQLFDDSFEVRLELNFLLF